MSRPMASIIMPAFNRERFISTAIDSVLAQTFGGWELIVIDDGSADHTATIVGEYERRHPEKVRLVRQENAGAARARNRALSMAAAPYIAFLDSDDLWRPDKLALQVPLAEQLGDFAFVYTAYETIDASSRHVRTVRPDPTFQGWIHDRLLTVDNEILGPTMLIRTENLRRVGGFDPSLRGGENLDLRLRLARLGPVHFVDEVLYSYRKHAGAATSDPDAVMADILAVLQKHLPAGTTMAEQRLRKRALSKYYRRYGDVCLQRDQRAQARTWYLKAWIGCEGRAELSLQVAKTFVGPNVYGRLRSLRRN